MLARLTAGLFVGLVTLLIGASFVSAADKIFDIKVESEIVLDPAFLCDADSRLESQVKFHTVLWDNGHAILTVNITSAVLDSETDEVLGLNHQVTSHAFGPGELPAVEELTSTIVCRRTGLFSTSNITLVIDADGNVRVDTFRRIVH